MRWRYYTTLSFQLIRVFISGYFDRRYYLLNHYDVRAGGISPLRHFIEFGGREGRNPSRKFLSSYYLEQYADVRSSGINPLIHYLKYGRSEGRHPIRRVQKMEIEANLTPKYNNEKVKVSVIIPAWNAEDTIAICLKSLIRQTHCNLEIVVVDDASSDQTGEIVKSMSAVDKRIQYHRLPENMGCYAAMNYGIRMSRGEVIAFQGADDVSLSVRIERQLEALLINYVQFTIANLINTNRTITELESENDAILLERAGYVFNGVTPGKTRHKMKAFLCNASNMFLRSVFHTYGLFWEKRMAADSEFLERIIYQELYIDFPSEFHIPEEYIVKKKYVKNLFYYIDEVLYLSPEKNEKNLTVKYPIRGHERENFRNIWRQRLHGVGNYTYPTL